MSGLRAGRLAPPAGRTELLLVSALAWLALVTIPLGLGGIGLSWDALNHHIYLGWTAAEPRFDHDWLAASYQAYQYPYLYWPAYQLTRLGASGAVAGLVLVSGMLLVVPALWLVARLCIRERSWYGTAMRTGAVVLALGSQLVLSLLDTTANDLPAAFPLVWAVALALWAADREAAESRLAPATALALSGVCAGLAVAFKFSNGPIALLLPLLWALAQGSPRERVLNVVLAGGCSAAAFLLAYGYWGWQMWEQFGNPMYPFYDGLFAPLRALLGWSPP